MVQYVPRPGWTHTARPDKLARLVGAELAGVAVHYEGGPGLGSSCTLAQSVQRLEQIRVSHTAPPPAGKGWQDIAYTACTDQAGRVFDLRGIEHRSAANGDQRVNRSHGAFLFLIGVGDVPTLAAVEAFTTWRRDVWLKRWPHAGAVVGHRDLHATECPGGALYRLVKAGQWARPTQQQEDPMAISDDDVQRIAAAVVELLTGPKTPHPVIVREGTGEFRIPDGRDAVTLPKALARVLDAVER